MSKPIVDLWAGFLAHEKLHPDRIDGADVMDLIELCEKLALVRSPCFSPYNERLACRRLICETAMDMGFDLPSIRGGVTNKYIIGRGLLDMWNEVAKKRYGSVKGTQSLWEAKRRNVVTKLAKQREEEWGQS